MKPLTLISLLVLILYSASANAQKRKPSLPSVPPCDRTIDQVPLIRGLRLGQSHSELKRLLPTQSESSRVDEYGVRTLVLFPLMAGPSSSSDMLAGIDMMMLTYFDDSLVALRIDYKLEASWPTNLHFVAAIAQQLKLPRHGWVQRDPSVLICRGFLVEVANARFRPSLRMLSPQAFEAMVERKAEVEERKRARFRP